MKMRREKLRIKTEKFLKLEYSTQMGKVSRREEKNKGKSKKRKCREDDFRVVGNNENEIVWAVRAEQ